MAERIIQEQGRAGGVVAARISGVDPSMNIIIVPNSDGDEAQVTSADVIAGKSYVHKIDAVLIPRSTLAFLDSFTADSDKKERNATVTEALTGNATAADEAVAAKAAEEGDAAANSTAANSTATSGAAAAVMAAAGLVLPAVVSMLMLL